MDEVVPNVPAHTLIRPIGKGAFGQVWLARNEIGIYRAVKIVSRTTLERENDFQREFKGIQKFEPVSRLHDGLVDVLQVGRSPDEKYFYYVMELGDDVEPRQEFALNDYEPRTLSAECRKRSRVPASETALIGAQLAGALEFLHKNGLIHRDIKPSNVLFVRGHAKIGDPGLVVAMEGQHSMGGTLGYMPPEGPGTPKADIFSLGKLLYVISTGKEPGEYPRLPMEMMTYPDAKDLQRLNQIILRACAYNPDARYATAEELRKDLLDVHAGGSPEETRRRLRLARRVGLVLLLLLMVIGAAYYRTLRQARAERARFAQSLMEAANQLQEKQDPLGALPFLGGILTTDPSDEERAETAARLISFTWRYSPRLLQQWIFTNGVNHVAIAPSGNSIATANAAGQVWLWAWRTERPRLLGEHRRAGKMFDADAVAFSDDEKWIASIGTDGVVKAWSLPATETKISIQLPAAGHALAFRPGTHQLIAGCEGAVYGIDLESGRTNVLLELPKDSAISLAVHSNGNTALAGPRGIRNHKGFIHEFHLDGTKSNHPPKPRLWVYDLGFSPNGSLAVAATGNRAHLNPIVEAESARLRHPSLVRSLSFDPIADPNGDRLLTACFDGTIRLWSCEDDGQTMDPISIEGLPTCVRFHPDGQTFTVTSLAGVVRVYRLLTFSNDAGLDLTWVSGDSMHYARVHLGTNVLVRNADTDWLEAAMTIPGEPISRLRLSHNGERLLTCQTNGPQLKFSLWDVHRSALVAETNLPPPMEVDLSPDGRSLAIRLTDRLVYWLVDSNQSFHWDWALMDPWNDAELCFSAKSPRVVVSWSTNVMVFSTTTGEVLSRWSIQHAITSVDITPTGDRVVVGESPSGLAPASIYVWEPESLTSARQVNAEPMVLKDGCFLARFNRYGPQLVLTDQANECVIVDRTSRKRIAFRQPPAITVDTDFSPTGRLFATLTGNRGGLIPTIRVWDYTTGQAMTPVLDSRFPGRLGSVRFIGGANGLLWFTRSGEWRRWRLGRMEATNEELAALSQLLSCRKISESGESIPISPQELDRLWSQLWSSHPDWFSSATQ